MHYKGFKYTMTITVSDTNGIKQYDVPDNIKTIIIILSLLIVVVISGLGFYVKTLNDKLTFLEKNIKAERIVEEAEKSKDIYLNLMN